MKLRLLLFSIFAAAVGMNAQGVNAYGTMFYRKLAHAPFPAPARDSGHTYKGKFFPRENHYDDSRVLFFIPKGFMPAEHADVVVYFHGWYNNIDTALVQFSLIEQFAAAGKNAVFLFPEGPKNAPDSHGGKLEEPGSFKRFIDEAMRILSDEKWITGKRVGKVILSGHSGAYRVIAKMLAQSPDADCVTEVFLFDGLYAETDTYLQWAKGEGHRFINIYTTDGGTKEESEQLMRDLDSLGVPFGFTNETDMNSEFLTRGRLLFIYSTNGHNSVIATRKQFQRFLEISGLSGR